MTRYSNVNLSRLLLPDFEEQTYKTPIPSIMTTGPLTRQSSCTFQSKKIGRIANTQSVEMDTNATANRSVVCMLRSWHFPGIVESQFFLQSCQYKSLPRCRIRTPPRRPLTAQDSNGKTDTCPFHQSPRSRLLHTRRLSTQPTSFYWQFGSMQSQLST